MAEPKRKFIKSYEKIDDKLREALKEAYPNGFADQIKTFDAVGGGFMTGVTLETEDAIYIIKFKAETESISDMQDDDPAGGDGDLDLSGAEDVEEEEEPDEVEKPVDNFDDIDVADESTTDR